MFLGFGGVVLFCLPFADALGFSLYGLMSPANRDIASLLLSNLLSSCFLLYLSRQDLRFRVTRLQ